jgi:glycosyltransferase involved in cell wall biosynthesis
MGRLERAQSLMSTLPLSILIVVENLPVPADTRVWKEARALTQAGYAISVVCPKGHGFMLPFERIEGIDIYRYSALEASGLLGYFLEYTWALLSQFFLAVKIFRKTHFRVLQGCNPPDTVFLIGIVFKIFGVRFIFDQHDPAPELYVIKFRREGLLFRMCLLAERLTFRTADVVIVTNDTAKEVAAARARLSPERLFVVRNCPDLKDFQLPSPSDELKEGRDKLVVYLGLMGPQDGLDLLISSIEYLVKTKGRKDTLFVLIGYGPELPRLQELVASRGLQLWVKFTGALFGENLRSYLATADVGVAPDPSNSFNDRVTMTKIMEYMASGLPTVLFDLKEGRITAVGAALFARSNDTQDFAEQVALLIDNKELRVRLGMTGQRRIYDDLNWESQIPSLLKAYEVAFSSTKIHPTFPVAAK